MRKYRLTILASTIFFVGLALATIGCMCSCTCTVQWNSANAKVNYELQTGPITATQSKVNEPDATSPAEKPAEPKIDAKTKTAAPPAKPVPVASPPPST